MLYTSKEDYGKIHLSKKAIQGENIWLNNNCNSCHQLYGLGGYLGPDLTNVYSNKNKNEYYLKAMFNSGLKSMPKFKFSSYEKETLIQFLKEVDQTGYYPNTSAVSEYNGWVVIKNKKYENR
ncbi:c-type cytochrome [Flavobacterium sp. RSB2_4_14]|uniref:c-type cytochrome n=1 Tax=Flavobacterium sp. RSB2_4_14 TaxID=3447665 RepID=UPI003F33DE97